MSPSDIEKSQAAKLAVSLVIPGMTVGLGSGTTSAIAIKLLGERYRTDPDFQIVGVATSKASAELAAVEGIPLLDVDDCLAIDLTLDGADEVDPSLRMIKGRGGALLREKLVAEISRRRLYLVDRSKRVERLGLGCPIPVEVSKFGLHHTERRLKALGARTEIRLEPDGQVYTTDGDNALINCRFEKIASPEELEAKLCSVVGVFESGFFLTYCDGLIVGSDQGAELIEAGR